MKRHKDVLSFTKLIGKSFTVFIDRITKKERKREKKKKEDEREGERTAV